MKIKTFIDRPILSAVISVMLLILGLIGLSQLPIEQFPEIAPPTVRVSATYTGANAETVQKSVIVPLEESINGVENMSYMVSSATNTGSASITIYFRQGTDPDMAMVNVQNRIASAQGLLPAEVTKTGISVRKRQTSNIKSIAIYSPDGTFDQKFLNNYMKINIEPRLSRIPGVGEANVFGSDYSMRIWLDPNKMAKYNLVPSDIATVLAEQNIESPTGTLGSESENTFQYVLKYRGRYENEEDYENLVIRALDNGEVLRLKDVATVELGLLKYTIASEIEGKPGATCMIAQTSGSNANEIIKLIDAEVEKISESLPKGMELVDLMSTKDFLDASIKNVVKTLVEAIILVVLVVYVFLQSFRSTLIPTIAIIVSLIGTFAFLYIIGFSLNMLTLFALVLVIGTVVDDAIVVVEAVQAQFDEGVKSPYTATISAMGNITSALITTTFVFMAVFIPVCFIGGTTGTFYTQFGLTMAIAVAISAINALTLSPALCALIMTPHSTGANGKKMSFSSRFHVAFDAGFNRLVNRYKFGVMFFLKHKWLAGALTIVACGGLVLLMNTTKTGLVPSEDMGTIFMNIQTAPGTSLAKTKEVMQEVEKELKKIPEIQIYSKVIGNSFTAGEGASNGQFIIRLRPWDERKGDEHSISAVIEKIYSLTDHITNATIRAFGQPMIPGYGISSGFEIYIQDQKSGSIDDLQKYTRQMIDRLNERPEMSPLGQYLTLTRVYGSESLSRFNLFSAIAVNGEAANGYSSGQAIQAVREVAQEVLPAGYGFEFGGMSREEASTGNTAAIVFIICVVFIYLILCALYESLFIPLAVILSVPFGLAGSFLFAKMFGLENNTYMQTGLIMLIGLLSKTAILLTEYASERRHHGLSITQAAISAAKVRLRPILMTSLTMIFGLLPMMFATGVGANGNISLGVGTVGGMLIGTVALLFVVPVLFCVFQYIQEKVMPNRKKPADVEPQNE